MVIGLIHIYTSTLTALPIPERKLRHMKLLLVHSLKFHHFLFLRSVYHIRQFLVGVGCYFSLC
jgi:hypothetical protein